MSRGTQEIRPRNGHTLKVIRIARVSTLNQDERSLEDQLALYQQYVERMYDGLIEYYDLATQGSGEELDRDEIRELEKLIESGEFDLVIAEDLARICRRLYAITICEICEDCGTRLIAINDRVDTADPGWRDGAFISSWHHERSNKDTSDRIRRSLRNRFLNGDILVHPGPFFIVPEAAKRIEDVIKNPDAELIVELGIEMLERGESYSDLADWLNEMNFPVGGQSKKDQWDVRLVKSRFLDPRLKGIEEWNNKKSVRDNKSGKRRSKNAPPDEKLTRQCSHMAYIDAQRFDQLKGKLENQHKHNRRVQDPSQDPLSRKPKKRTPFPGQSIYCGICGYKFVFGGHGQQEHLVCDGARHYHCWNGITIDGPLAASKIAEAVLQEYESLPDFDECFLKLVNEEAEQADDKRQQQLRELRKDARQCEREIDNYLKFIAQGQSSTVRERLEQAEEKVSDLQNQIRYLEGLPSDRIEIPSSDDLKQIARNIIRGTTAFTWDMNKIFRQLIPRIVVFPHRLIDGGHIELRARFRLRLGQLCPDERCREALHQSLERLLCVDLFDPPQREAHRAEVMRMRGMGMTEREVAERLGITHTAAQRAAMLQREMDRIGANDPYQEIREPPEDYTKLRRHHHKRYKFQPLSDAGCY